MRKALVVGIDYYKACTALHGCVNDAYAVKSVLDRHSDGSVNFATRLLAARSASNAVSRVKFKDSIKELFTGDCEIALFYFAGHGHIETSGGYLAASDSVAGDDGIPLGELLALANNSPARNKIILLDSCHSGFVGSSSLNAKYAELAEGTTILTASTAEQYASEKNGSGVFTSLMVDALNGAASNLLGDVTPGSVYAHIDQSLGPWDQRPVFKSNVKSFVSLRKTQAPVSHGELMQIHNLFPAAGHEYRLDPTYEPESDNPNPTNVQIFKVLQKLNRVNVVVPVGAPHMYFAAMESKSCKLTVVGEHYRHLVEQGRI